MKISVTNIQYDVDEPEDLQGLPETMTFNINPEHFEGEHEIDQWVSDAISARTGFCHKGFEWQEAG